MYLLSDHQKWLHCYVSLLEGTWNCSGFQDFALVTGLLDSGGVAFAWSGRLVIRHTTCILYQKDSLEVKAETIHGWFMAKINSDLDHRTVPFIWVDFGGSCCRPFWPYTQVASPGFFFIRKLKMKHLKRSGFAPQNPCFFLVLWFFFDFRNASIATQLAAPSFFKLSAPVKSPRTVHVDRPNRVENRFSVTSAEKLAERRAGAATCDMNILGRQEIFLLGKLPFYFLETNMTGWKIAIFNIHSSSFVVDVPLSW